MYFQNDEIYMFIRVTLHNGINDDALFSLLQFYNEQRYLSERK